MANISSYNQLSSWNEDDDLLFVQQPDAPKKAHPSQMKEYILEGLDVPSVGGTGKYISAISEADGKISATAETMDTAPTEGSSKAVTSGGIKTAIDDSVSLKTATGNPITLTDAAEAKVEELSMTIEPVQSGSGDPSPTNVRPISGLTEGKVIRTGKNLLPLTVTGIKNIITGATWDENSFTYGGVTFTILTDEKGLVTGFKANGTATSRISIPLAQLVKGYGDTKVNAAMSEVQGSDEAFVVAVWIQGGNAFTGRLASLYVANDYSLNIDNRSENCYLGIGIANGYTANNLIISPMIRLSTETDRTFEPYTANTATITFGQTVYGGSVDFKTGEVTVAHGVKTYDGTTQTNWNVVQYTNLCAFIPLPEVGTGHRTFILSNIFKSYEVITNKPNGTNGISIEGISAGLDGLFVGIGGLATDKNSWLSYLQTHPLTICYELATPVTLTLTPAELELLKGNNTITANGAEISLSYYPDNAIGALAGRVDKKADITYVDNVVDGVVKHVAGELSITIPLSDSWTVAIFGTISVTPISAILTVVSGGSVSVTDLTSNSLASRADISVSVSDKTITLTSKNTDKFYVNIVY